MKNSTAIKRVQRLLADPKKWAKGHYAFTKGGDECDPEDKRACRFCVGGAFARVIAGMNTDNPQAWEIDAILKKAMPNDFRPRSKCRVTQYNDTRTHRNMLLWLDRAIKIATNMEAA